MYSSMEQTHCRRHGIELEEKTLTEAKALSLFFRAMFFLKAPSKYNRQGVERIYMCCSKGDELVES